MRKLGRFDIFVFIPLIIFTFLFVPLIDTPVCWDAAAEWGLVNVFYNQGIHDYSIINITHPPFKPFLASISFSLFGSSTISYNLVGFLVGHIGILGIYFLSKSLFNKNVAVVSSLLLSTSPLFLANGVNNLNDYMLTSLIILALYFYSQRKLSLYTVIISAAVLTKETAALVPLSVLFIEFVFNLFTKQIFKKNTIAKFLMLTIPLISLFVWHQYARINGRVNTWGWNSDRGAFSMVINNLLTLNIFTSYTKEHIARLLFLNFNWVYWIIVGIGAVFGLKKIRLMKIEKYILNAQQKEKTIFIIFLFVITYVLTVMTFQVPPTARYHLPLIPFLLVGVAVVINKYITKMPISGILLFGAINFVGLFFSIDPISSYIWGVQVMEGQRTYTKSTGDDALVYNLQYLLILRQRRNEIISQYKEGIYKKLDWNGDPYTYTKHCNFRS
ncbi:MAG: glycosyltransferase family 39 protein [Candidatus Levybacteria bacterium]|nr:glycosyltransferase family 39 protein [Candidatus Levybacteria bacterium]